MSQKWNTNNPAIKRLLSETKEFQKNPSPDFTAAPLEDDIFIWHFTIRGPPGTDFEGGIYHGRILFPADYPFKPPNIELLTPNGRFEVGKKICLSISAHHPETWQPSWSIRTVLTALIAFFPTEAAGSVGSLDLPSDARKRLAGESPVWKCEKCGMPNLEILPPTMESPAVASAASASSGGDATSPVPPPSTPLSNFPPEAISFALAKSPSQIVPSQHPQQTQPTSLGPNTQELLQEFREGGGGLDDTQMLQQQNTARELDFTVSSPSPVGNSVNSDDSQAKPSGGPAEKEPLVENATASSNQNATPANVAPTPEQRQPTAVPAPSPARRQQEDDRVLLFMILAVVAAIVAILARKFMRQL